jgi:uncharacterized membrane protein YkvA (DUF1232 family)
LLFARGVCIFSRFAQHSAPHCFEIQHFFQPAVVKISSMKFLEGLRGAARDLKRHIAVYRLVLSHPRTPRVSKILLGAAIGYLLLPFDLIPDFIPIIGHLDDLVIVPAMFMAAMRMIPPEVVEECRRKVPPSEREIFPV